MKRNFHRITNIYSVTNKTAREWKWEKQYSWKVKIYSPQYIQRPSLYAEIKAKRPDTPPKILNER